MTHSKTSYQVSNASELGLNLSQFHADENMALNLSADSAQMSLGDEISMANALVLDETHESEGSTIYGGVNQDADDNNSTFSIPETIARTRQSGETVSSNSRGTQEIYRELNNDLYEHD